MGYAVAQLVKTTIRKVACSITDGVIKKFLLTYTSGSTMALGSTQLLTEMSTRNISKPVRRADMCLLS